MTKEEKMMNDVALMLESGMKVLGFTQAKSTYRKVNAFYNRSLGVVIKRPSCIIEVRTPSHLCVPTIKLKHGWVVQPIVKKTNLKEAVKQIERKLKPYRAQGISPDLHVENVGWYKGEPLMFDW